MPARPQTPPRSAAAALLLLAPSLMLLITLMFAPSCASAANANAVDAAAKQMAPKHCPDAACNVATTADLRDTLAALLVYLQPVAGTARAVVTDPGAFRGCESNVISPDPNVGFGSDCSIGFADTVPSVFLITSCPYAYRAALQSTCAGVLRDDQNEFRSFLPILAQGINENVGYCAVDIAGTAVPPGWTVMAEASLACVFDANAFLPPAAAGRGPAAAGSSNATLVAPAKGRSIAAAALALVDKAASNNIKNATAPAKAAPALALVLSQRAAAAAAAKAAHAAP